MRFDKIINCENCPCKNNDYENGSSCNLDYTMDYVQVELGKEKSWQNHLHLSPDCKLNAVYMQEGKSFVPQLFTGEIHVIGNYGIDWITNKKDNL